MKVTRIIALAAPIFAIPTPQEEPAIPIFTLIPQIEDALVPQYGIVTGLAIDSQPGSCQGFNGTDTVPIDCDCPPPRFDFIQRLEEYADKGNIFGIPINFPVEVDDLSLTTRLARAQACIDTLQNFDNTAFGEGCPVESAPFFVVARDNLLREQLLQG